MYNCICTGMYNFICACMYVFIHVCMHVCICMYICMYVCMYVYMHEGMYIRLPTSATSLRPLRSLDRRELFVPQTRTTIAMSRSFAVIAPSLWNRLPPSSLASRLSSNLPTSLSLLKTCLFS